MSSWKNAHKAHQKPHRERHQPDARKHLGLLEKKKDYKLRADDYNAKKSELQYLHKRALDRNPDEFYYHMVNSQVRDDGTHVDKAKRKELTPEQIMLMQTQDYKYISTRRNLEANKINKLSSQLHQLDNSVANQHTFFVDDEKQVRAFSLQKKLGTPKELLNRRYNRLRTEDLLKMKTVDEADSTTIATLTKERSKAYKELQQRRDREKKLLTLQRKMEIKCTLQDKTRTVKSKIRPESKDEAPVYEWKWERKR